MWHVHLSLATASWPYGSYFAAPTVSYTASRASASRYYPGSGTVSSRRHGSLFRSFRSPFFGWRCLSSWVPCLWASSWLCKWLARAQRTTFLMKCRRACSIRLHSHDSSRCSSLHKTQIIRSFTGHILTIRDPLLSWDQSREWECESG